MYECHAKAYVHERLCSSRHKFLFSSSQEPFQQYGDFNMTNMRNASGHDQGRHETGLGGGADGKGDPLHSALSVFKRVTPGNGFVEHLTFNGPEQ